MENNNTAQLEALRAEWAVLRRTSEAMLERDLCRPTEHLTAHAIEWSVSDDYRKYRLIFRLIDEGNALRPFKYNREEQVAFRWDSAFHYICSNGRRRLMRAVLMKHADDADILRIPLGDDDLNAVETLMSSMFTENWLERFEGDEELIHYKISTRIAIFLQSGKTTTTEVIRASDEYCDIEDRIERVIRSWNVRLAAIWCCMCAGDGALKDIAGLLGHILQRTWAFGKKEGLKK